MGTFQGVDAVTLAKLRNAERWGEAVQSMADESPQKKPYRLSAQYRYSLTEKGRASNKRAQAKYLTDPEHRKKKAEYHAKWYQLHRESELARVRARREKLKKEQQ